MVEYSPAALPAAASNQRKHSPWTAGRERKKTKAECHDAADDIEEEEEEEADDHEMTEQEAHVVACLGKLNVGILGSHSDADEVSTSLASMASAPEGQRRKVRGFRANLSAGYHSRLRSCLLSDKGSPLARSSRSCTSGQRTGDRGQENTPPLLFSTAEQAKCWLAPRQPSSESPSCHHPHPVTSVAQYPPRVPHAPLPTDCGNDEPATTSRGKFQEPYQGSPTFMTRVHRRSHSGNGLECGRHLLADSAEALCGHLRGEGCSAALQPRQQCPDAKVASAGLPSALAHERTCHPVALQPHHDLPSLPSAPVQASSSNDAAPAPGAPSPPPACGSIATYGIAAFGVPAAVQSCFAGAMGFSASQVGLGLEGLQQGRQGAARSPLAPLSAAMADAASAPLAGGPTSNRTASTSAALRPAAFMAAVGAANAPAAGWAAGIVPPAGGFAASNWGLSSVGAPAAASLADSAEDLDLRRMARQHPSAPTALQPEQRHRFVAEPMAAPGPIQVGPATVAPAPFDLAALALSSGSLLSGSHGIGVFRSVSAAAGPAFMSAVSASTGIGSVATGKLPAGLAVPDAHRAATDSGVAAPLHLGSWQPLPAMGRQDPGASAQLTQRLQAAAAGGAPCLEFDPDSGPTPPGRGAPWQLRNSGGGGAHPADQECGLAGGADGEEGDDDEEEGAPWLRTSEQAPDPDDPASAGKYSAALLRRLQQAAEHEELHGAVAGHPGGLYLMLAAGGSGPCGYGRNPRTTNGSGPRHGSGCSSMEPSPMPRLSSRLRRLRASPYAGSGGGPPSSQTSSQLGTRSRSAGVTPGGGDASRRLRRRSHLVSEQFLSYGSGGRGGCETDGSDDEEDGDGGMGCGLYAADHDMNEAGHHYNNGQPTHAARHHSAQFQHVQRGSPGEGLPPASFSLGYGMSTSFTYGTSLLGVPQHHGHHHPDSSTHSQLAPSPLLAGGSLDFLRPPRSNVRAEHGLPGQQCRPAGESRRSRDATRDRAQPAAGGTPRRRRSAAHQGPAFLNGLMDYDDEGVEYSTPPHTPLRGIGSGHDAATVPQPAGDTAAPSWAHGFGAQQPAARAAGAARGLLAAPPRPMHVAQAGNRPRVSFASQPGRRSSDLESPWLGPGGPPDDDGGGAVVQWLAAADSMESTQKFNRLIGKAANDNHRGTAERLWHEMCSRGVAPDVNTLNALLRSLSRSAADPDEAQLLVRDVCGRGGFSPNGTSQRLMEEICFRFEQLQAVFVADRASV